MPSAVAASPAPINPAINMGSGGMSRSSSVAASGGDRSGDLAIDAIRAKYVDRMDASKANVKRQQSPQKSLPRSIVGRGISRR